MYDKQPSESAKKVFGARLKDLRLDAGLSGVELAERYGWNKSKVSKIEHGTQTPSDADIRVWAIACGAETEMQELIALSREIDQMWTEYRQRHKRGMKNLQLQQMDLYAKTNLFRVYESLYIPGFLQTLDYTRAQFTIHAELHGLPLDDVEQAAQNRMARKRFLGTGKPMFAFLLEESALCNNTGGRDVMNAQLDFLIEADQMPYVSIGILPLGRSRSLYPGEGFYLYDESLLRQEFWSGSFQTARPDNIAYFARVFGALRDQAVFGSAAYSVIDGARHRLE